MVHNNHHVTGFNECSDGIAQCHNPSISISRHQSRALSGDDVGHRDVGDIGIHVTASINISEETKRAKSFFHRVRFGQLQLHDSNELVAYAG